MSASPTSVFFSGRLLPGPATCDPDSSVASSSSDSSTRNLPNMEMFVAHTGSGGVISSCSWKGKTKQHKLYIYRLGWDFAQRLQLRTICRFANFDFYLIIFNQKYSSSFHLFCCKPSDLVCVRVWISFIKQWVLEKINFQIYNLSLHTLSKILWVSLHW